MIIEGNEYDPEVAYKVLVACKKMGIVTAKGEWTINRVEELKSAGSQTAFETAFKEATELWEGFDPTKKIPVV